MAGDAPTPLGLGVGKFLDSLPSDLRHPETFPVLRAAADGAKFGPQAASIVQVALGPAAAFDAELNHGPRPLAWPADHGMHMNVENEWYFLVSALTINNGDGGRIALVTVPMRYTSVSQTVRDDLKWSPTDAQLVDSNVKLAIVTPDVNVNVLRETNVKAGIDGGLELVDAPWRTVVGCDRLEGAAREPFPMHAHYEGEDLTIDLVHDRTEPYFLQGADGYIPNSDTAGWLYYSLAQIRTTGTIVYGGKTYEVSGDSWYDHQWGTAAPPVPTSEIASPIKPTRGWVWFGFNFEDGSAITFSAGHAPTDPPDPPLTGWGKLVLPNALAATFITGTIRLTDYVTSPRTGVQWPCGWEFDLAGSTLAGHQVGMHIHASPWAKDQLGMFAFLEEYYEGGADLTLTNTYTDTVVTGTGFCEAVGFEKSEAWWARAKEWLETNTG